MHRIYFQPEYQAVMGWTDTLIMNEFNTQFSELYEQVENNNQSR